MSANFGLNTRIKEFDGFAARILGTHFAGFIRLRGSIRVKHCFHIGGSAGELINSAIPGNAAVAQPQAYALGAVGLAIQVPAVANQSKEAEGGSDTRSLSSGYSVLSPVEDKNGNTWRQTGDGDDLELYVMGPGDNHEAIDENIVLEHLKVSQAMSDNYLKVLLTSSLKEALENMSDGQQNCVLVVDSEDHLERILTYGDIKRRLLKNSGDFSNGEPSSPKVCDMNSYDNICSGLLVLQSGSYMQNTVFTKDFVENPVPVYGSDETINFNLLKLNTFLLTDYVWNLGNK